MTTTYEEFDFSGSMGATVAAESSKHSDFQREIEFLTLKADTASISQGADRAIVRLVNENERKPWMGDAVTKWSLPWITVKQHYAPTKQRPPYAREGSRWPEKMYCVCRKDKIYKKKFNDNCEVCNGGTKASDRTWALGIEREQVIEGGRVVGIRDKTRNVLAFGADGKPIVIGDPNAEKKEYQHKEVPAWVVLNFGYKNFFNALSGQASYFQTVLGRDFVIQRTGTDNNDTNYTFIPLDPITITGEWAASLGVPEGTPYDLGYPIAQVDDGKGGTRTLPLGELLYPDMPDLRHIINDRVSEDYYGRFFIPGWVPEGFDPTKVTTQQGQQGVQNGVQQGYSAPAGTPTQPAAPVTPDAAPAAEGVPAGAPAMSQLEALKARVQAGSGGTA